MYLKNLKIGNVELKNNILLAPMAGITDLPFRILCRENGASLAFTEMVSSKALFYGDEKTKKLLNTQNEAKPIAVQLFGNDIQSMEFATKYVNNIADIIDINMGCPAPKIVKNGAGSRLLLNLDLAEEIVKAVVQVSTHPVSVKLRAGWDENNIVAVEAAKRFEKAGASMITIHGRTRSEFYSGKCNLDIIKAVKEAVSIPVIGNGDICSTEDAIKMFEYTKVDGIMIGRASLGNPWIFKEIISGLKNEKYEKPSLDEKFEVIKRHIEMEIAEKGENVAIKEMRKNIAWYIKGLKDATVIRNKINTIDTKADLIDCLTEYFKTIQNKNR